MSIDTKSIKDIIQTLSKEPRPPDSEGLLNARVFIKEYLKSENYSFEEYRTYIPKWKQKTPPILKIKKPENLEITAMPAVFSPSTPPDGITGEIGEAPPIMILDHYEWERFCIKDQHGRVLGYLISTKYSPTVQPLPLTETELPCIILPTNVLIMIKNWLSKGVSIEVEMINSTEINSKSEIVSLISKEPKNSPYLMICAHYDSMYNSPGAHDNASGVAVLAKLAKDDPKLKESCRIAFFDGEELNKIGSYHFVESLEKINKLNQISLVLEVDSVGIGDEIALMCSKKISKKLRAHFENFPLEGFSLVITSHKKIGFCDVWPFMQKRIPVIRMLSRPIEKEKNGKFREIFHKPIDTYEKIEEKSLEISYKIIKKIIDFTNN